MRLRLFLLMTSIVAAVALVTVVLADRLGSGGRASDQVVGAPDDPDRGSPVERSTTTAGGAVPGPGQVRVSGSVTTAMLTGAVLQPRELAAPLTVVSERGFGNGGDVTGVRIDGRPASIAWDGGRPFVLSSGPGLVLDPVEVHLRPDGLQLVLGGGAHAVAPGMHRLDTPVAVGSAGIATPRDSVSFEAVDGSLLEARGDASLVLGAPGPWRLIGPGRVLLGGALELTTAAGASARDRVDAGEGAYDLTFTPDGPGAWTVAGVVTGSLAG